VGASVAVEPNWPVLLPSSEFGVAFAMEAVREWRNRDRFPAYCFLVCSIIALTIAATVGAGRDIGTPQIEPPSPVHFAVVAIIVSALAAGLHHYRGKVLLTRRASFLADRLDDFAQICRARIVNSHSLTTSEFDVEQRKLHDQYLDAYGEEIRSVHRALTVHNEAFSDLLDTMLGSLPVRTLRMPEFATWVAKTLRLEATLLQRERPRPWLDSRLIMPFCLYLALASAVWLTLFFASRR
jgi:hypothetical protein